MMVVVVIKVIVMIIMEFASHNERYGNCDDRGGSPGDG